MTKEEKVDMLNLKEGNKLRRKKAPVENDEPEVIETKPKEEILLCAECAPGRVTSHDGQTYLDGAPVEGRRGNERRQCACGRRTRNSYLPL